MLGAALPGPKTIIFGCQAPRAHTKAPYKNDLLWETLRVLNRPLGGPDRPRLLGRPPARAVEAPLRRRASVPAGRGVGAGVARGQARCPAGTEEPFTAGG